MHLGAVSVSPLVSSSSSAEVTVLPLVAIIQSSKLLLQFLCHVLLEHLPLLLEKVPGDLPLCLPWHVLLLHTDSSVLSLLLIGDLLDGLL